MSNSGNEVDHRTTEQKLVERYFAGGNQGTEKASVINSLKRKGVTIPPSLPGLPAEKVTNRSEAMTAWFYKVMKGNRNG